MHAKMCINDAKFHCSFLARRIHQSLTNTHTDCFSDGLWLIHRWYYTISVIHEYGADAFFKEKVTGPLSVCNDFRRGEQVFLRQFFFSTSHVI